MKFSDFNFEPTLKSAIDKLGYIECTPVQDLTIPLGLDGKDVSGLAQTGTGKTAAFLLPIMERILRARPLPEGAPPDQVELAQKRAFPDWRSQNFILILVPTRELAEQVFENVTKLSEFSGLRGISVYGGTSYDKQKEGFKAGVEFVVATPGRLIDLYKEHIVDLKQVRAIVFDEADRMFDMGFKDDMKFILQRVPRERQFLVFSATLNFDVLNTAYQFGAEPVEIDVSRDQPKAENVKDVIFHTGQDDKPMILLSLLKKHSPKQVIVFSNFKMNVERIAAFLSTNGYPAMAISSLLSQAQRNRVIELFKTENEQNILVATDVAARGLDIKGVDLVVNYELPQDAESYVHRIGRTGRAGTEGQAFSLVSDRDVDSLQRIEDYLKHKVEAVWLEEVDLVKDFKPPPSESYSGFRPQRGDQGPPRGDRQDRKGGPPPRRNDRRPPRGGERPRPERREGSPAPGGYQGSRPHNNQRPQQARGPRPEGRSPHPRDGQPRENRDVGHQRQDGPRGQGPRPHQANQRPRNEGPARGGNGKHPHRPTNGPQSRRTPQGKPHPVVQKTLTQKVSGFFKKIFGD